MKGTAKVDDRLIESGPQLERDGGDAYERSFQPRIEERSAAVEVVLVFRVDGRGRVGNLAAPKRGAGNAGGDGRYCDSDDRPPNDPVC